eukprot:6086622-Pyramimonas_sp.AAC.1
MAEELDWSTYDVEVAHHHVRLALDQSEGRGYSMFMTSALHFASSIASQSKHMQRLQKGDDGSKKLGRPPKPRGPQRNRCDAWNDYVAQHPPAKGKGGETIKK